jgi:hypothetical protein
LPQPWAAGFPDKAEFKIGGEELWLASDPQAQVGMLEYTGNGLKSLEVAMEHKEKMMAALGARLLEETKRAAEVAETLKIRQSGEQSVLKSLSQTVGAGITLALSWAVTWAGGDSKGVIMGLNSDYVDEALKGEDLKELVGLWQSQGVSYETLYYNLQRGELTRPGVNAEAELKQIDSEDADNLDRTIERDKKKLETEEEDNRALEEGDEE